VILLVMENLNNLISKGDYSGAISVCIEIELNVSFPWFTAIYTNKF
jgi:hypothetical protein